jgi:hypothetical protein
MLSEIFFLLAVDDIPAKVSAEVAYSLLKPVPVVSKCCGQCKGGVIIHGDGHQTPCPCPANCKCRTKSILLPGCKTCPSPQSK